MHRLDSPHTPGGRGGPEFLAIIRHYHHNSLIVLELHRSMRRVDIMVIIRLLLITPCYCYCLLVDSLGFRPSMTLLAI